MRFKTSCFSHQLEGFEYAKIHPKFLLGDEQGLGKTKQAIDIAVYRKYSSNVRKCLIVCCVNSTKYNWYDEIEIHSFEGATLIDGSTTQRIDKIEEWRRNGDYFGIINVEALRQEDIINILKNVPMVILDEAHKCKNPNSKQGKAIHKFSAKYRIALTGTPIQNKALDVYNILRWLGVENRNFFAFRNRYCIMGQFRNVVGYKNLREINEKLNSVMLRRLKNDVLDLPPKVYKTEFVELTEEQMFLYRQNKESVLERLRRGIDIPSNPLTLLMDMRKVVGGLLTKSNPKLDRLKELLADIKEEGKKVIIFSNYKEITSMVCDEISMFRPLVIDGDVDVKDRQERVRDFQNAEGFKVILGTIGAMGTGLTLNTAEYVIFFDKNYNPSENEQAEDRSHRIGTKNTVNVITLVAKNTVDERVERLLRDKKEVIDYIVDGAIDNSKMFKYIMEG